ncbi:MAG: hypothetical protein H6574_06430 [Lewinellaceae bacterium]|nr:hypothetical protein [Saprospiraceae bacterium]MCB9316339.1 hypothetical protein [Lewinellaceae bacterium]MCB9330700.1 hypothetical protein [Lewinellaceae bacterium]
MRQTLTIKILLVTGFALFGACNHLDPELIDAVQTRLGRIQESRPELEDALRNTTHLIEQIQKAPIGLRRSPEFGFEQLASDIESLNADYRKLQEKYNALYTKLDGLMGNYVDGQIKKKVLVEGMNNFEKTMSEFERDRDALALRFNEYSAKYARMSATFAALPAPEQAALNSRYDSSAVSIPKPEHRPTVKKPVEQPLENTSENTEQQQ